MENDFIEKNVRTRLIVAGINELEERGIRDFSLRRAALRAEAIRFRGKRSRDRFNDVYRRYSRSYED